jgi:TfoX/Sxy family transcriptional regulator of competence genes
MPGFAKSPPALIARFDSVALTRPGAERRQMFGYPCLFVGGNLASGLYESGWFVRLGPDDTAELLATDGAHPFEPMAGRPMRGYTVMPDGIVADDLALGRWVDRAIAYVAAMPPKASKPKAKAPKAKPTGSR